MWIRNFERIFVDTEHRIILSNTKVNVHVTSRKIDFTKSNFNSLELYSCSNNSSIGLNPINTRDVAADHLIAFQLSC